MRPDEDMAARWTPSHEQDQAALEVLQSLIDPSAPLGGSRYVYTGHLLVGKEHGWWSEDIELVHLDGVFTDRDEVSKLVEDEARKHHEEHGKPVSGGYTVHHLPRQGDPDIPRSGQGEMWLTMWAVFEDILAIYPVPEWSRRAKR